MVQAEVQAVLAIGGVLNEVALVIYSFVRGGQVSPECLPAVMK